MENKTLEMRRQAFHITAGLVSVFLISSGMADWRFFLFILAVGIPVSLISRKRRLPIVARLLDYF